MAISNLSNQHISASFQYLAQISASGNIYDGFGNQITQLNLVTSSYVTAQTASYASFAQSGNGLFSGSFSGSGTNLNSIPVAAITGNFRQIATGSVTASVTPSQFSVVSGSITEFQVTGTGVTIGNAISDSHRVTGSLNISGSTNVNGNTVISGSLLVSSGSSTEFQVTGTGVTIGSVSTDIHTVTGSLNISGSMSMTGPSIQNSAPLVSTLISGSTEFDGATFYRTVDASGRTLNANHHLYYLPTTILHSAAINTPTDVFSGSLHAFTMQPNSFYEVQYNLFYQKAVAGTVTWTINGGAQTWQNINVQIERTAIAAANGISTGSIAPFSTTGVAPIYTSHINGANLTSIALSSGADAVGSNQRVIIKAQILSNAAISSVLRLQHAYSAGVTSFFPGCYYTIKKMPASSVGIFIA